MKLKKSISVTLFLVLVTAVFAVPSLAADKTDDAGTKWNIYFRPGVRFGTESRVLYIMDFLIPLYQDENNIFFSNIKYTPNDHDGWELNVGAGYRRLLWEEKLLLGLNAYYDQRKTDWGTDHEQWGVGLEAMADIPLEAFNLGLTGRFNYYYPLSHTRIDGLGTPYASYALSDSGIILYGGRVEEPMRGFDYEAGVRIPYISDYVEIWSYVGGYHYKGRRVRDINGFMARLEVIPTDFMRLNYEFHYDNYEKGEHYGEVTFEVPFSIGNLVTGSNPFEGIGDVFTGSRDLKARMVEPTRRDVDVKVMVDTENDNIPGGNEEVEDIVFVSETGSDVTGDGTIKNPYATISYALANDARILAGTCKTIHVMNSSTTAVIDEAAGAGLTLGIADFLLWGSGANHPKYPNIINMPYTGHPTINDTLALNAANPTVTGLGFDVSGSAYCIDIQNGTGGEGIKITNNRFFMSRFGDAYGIYSLILTAGIGTEDNPILIAGNSFDIESMRDDAYGIRLIAGGVGNNIFATITGNDMSNTITGDTASYGISLLNTDANIGSDKAPVVISGNTITVNSGGDAYGIRLEADEYIFAAITGNDMSNTITGGNDAYGIYLDADEDNIGSETSPVIISGNPMTVNAADDAYGIYLYADDGDIFTTITGNDMSNTITGADAAYGIYLDADEESIGSETSPVIISGNPMSVTGTAGEAYGIRLVAEEYVFATITGNNMLNTIEGGTFANGIRLYSDNASIGSEAAPVIISGNPMTVTGGSTNALGIRLNADDDIFATITGNDLSNTITAGGYAIGILVDADTGSIGSDTRPLIISGNPITATSTGSYAYGLNIRADDYLFAKITGNDMSNTITGSTFAYGMYLETSTGDIGSATNPVLISGNPISVAAATSYAYGIRLNSNTNIFTTITGNNMSGGVSADGIVRGIYLDANNGSIGSATRPVIVSGNPISVTSLSNNAYGINFQSNNDIFATISGNNMTVTADDTGLGIYLNALNGSIGSTLKPVIVSGNFMWVIGNNDNAFGIYSWADSNNFAVIKSNYMNITSVTDNAYGGVIFAGDYIGDVNSLATYFVDNAGIIDGATGRYMLQLVAGTPGNGNFVAWGDCSFTPVGGVWSGNYGLLNQVWHNFTIPPDVLTP